MNEITPKEELFQNIVSIVESAKERAHRILY